MKNIPLFLINLLWLISSTAQTIGFKSMDTRDLKTYTASVTEDDKGKYNIKYDGFDFSKRLNKYHFFS